ncbi:MAG TPA: ABC transporter substrate-binding protein [Micromonosporaceae bacterium]
MRFPRTAAVAALAVTLALAGCGSSGSSDKKNTGDANKPLDKVHYATGFGMFGREAYIYVGIKKGFFKDAGIDVDVKPGAGTSETTKLVAGGQIDFAPVDFTGELILLGSGKATGITALAAIHQRTLAGVMTLEGRGISSPKDLEGKTFGDSPNSTTTLMFPTYAKLANIDPNKVKIVNFTPPQLPAMLAAGKVDVIGQFAVGKPTIEKAAGGKKAVFLAYSDYLTDLYGNALVTRSQMVKDNPDLVKRFIGALMKSLQWSIDHPDEAGQILHEYQPQQDPTTAAAEMTLMASYVRSSSSGVPVGAFDQQRVARSIAILQAAGAIKQGLTPDQVVDFDLAPKG